MAEEATADLTAGVADAAPTQPAAGPPESRSFLPIVLWSAAGVAILAAGSLLWAARGEAVFMDMVASAIAMCF
jgi:hypothetical protein